MLCDFGLKMDFTPTSYTNCIFIFVGDMSLMWNIQTCLANKFFYKN